jgi:hypothetical protein
MRLFVRFALVVALCLALPSIALATQVEALSMRQLVEGADHIVVGTVIAREAHWDDLDRIVTDSTIRVEDTLLGAPSETLVVRHIGGVVGELGLTVAGEAAYPDGARMLLFLRTYHSGDAGDVMRPVGMSQGEMPIVAGASGEVVLPGAAGVSVVSRSPSGQLLPAPAAIAAPVGRDELLSRIRDLVLEVHP